MLSRTREGRRDGGTEDRGKERRDGGGGGGVPCVTMVIFFSRRRSLFSLPRPLLLCMSPLHPDCRRVAGAGGGGGVGVLSVRSRTLKDP